MDAEPAGLDHDRAVREYPADPEHKEVGGLSFAHLDLAAEALDDRHDALLAHVDVPVARIGRRREVLDQPAGGVDRDRQVAAVDARALHALGVRPRRAEPGQRLGDDGGALLGVGHSTLTTLASRCSRRLTSHFSAMETASSAVA